MFGSELSLGNREDFSRGQPGYSVAACLEENKFESVDIQVRRELLCLFLSQMKAL